MKNQIFSTALAVTAIVFLATSCKKDTQTDLVNSFKNEEIRILTEKGFNVSSIVDKGDYYLVEKDIVIKKKNVSLLSEKVDKKMNSVKANEVRSDQAYETLVQTNNISVFIEPAIAANSSWLSIIYQAFADWNSVSNFGIQFTVSTTNSSSDITILDAAVAPGEVVAAEMPVNGNPGSTIYIDLSQQDDDSYRRLRLVHEIGHTLGFRHTNYNGETGTINYINGTVPSTGSNSNPDLISVLNTTPYLYLQQWIGFSPMDRLAIRTLYPLDNTQRPIFRYYKNARHFYTTNWNELGYNTQGWSYEGYEGFIFSNSGSGRSVVYRYYHPSKGDYIYTQNFSELGGGRHGYVPEGTIGFAYIYQVSGSIPLYRFFKNQAGGLHFYTTNQAEGSGWVSEGICCYVMP